MFKVTETKAWKDLTIIKSCASDHKRIVCRGQIAKRFSIEKAGIFLDYEVI